MSEVKRVVGHSFIMRGYLKLLVLLWISKSVVGDGKLLEKLLVDIIEAWQLLSPTIIVVEEETPKLCMTHQWTLCLTNDMDNNYLAEHMASMHQGRKQDGVIFAGIGGHRQLIKDLAGLTPSLFRSNCPVFLPIDYSRDIKLRLDSNVVFYQEDSPTNYKFLDKFAVKGALPTTLNLAKWNMQKGFTFHASKNRWERRTDLGGVALANTFPHNKNWATFIKDENGTIVGSSGLFQDKLLYITDKLNLTVRTTDAVSKQFKELENGSWSGGIGQLQRKEADVCSPGWSFN